MSSMKVECSHLPSRVTSKTLAGDMLSQVASGRALEDRSKLV